MSRWSQVYIIAKILPDGMPEPPVKVGISEHLGKRLRQIQTSSPFRVGVFYSLQVPFRDMARCLEKRFHDAHRTKRLHGEWFDMPLDMALWFTCINFLLLLHQLGATQEEIADRMARAGIHGNVLEFCECYGGPVWESLLKTGDLIDLKETV